jgi:hypothetical protein
VFSVDDRDRARDHVLGLAEADRRLVSAAVAISALQRESTEAADLAARVDAQLRELADSSGSQPSR